MLRRERDALAAGATVSRAEIADLVNSYELQEPVTIEDCRAIFDDVKTKLAAGNTLDVVMRGLGSEKDPGPKRVDVVVNAGLPDVQTCSISIARA